MRGYRAYTDVGGVYRSEPFSAIITFDKTRENRTGSHNRCGLKMRRACALEGRGVPTVRSTAIRGADSAREHHAGFGTYVARCAGCELRLTKETVTRFR